MPNPKTEIDKAPYIAYADKPGTIYDGSGGGGGGGGGEIGPLAYVSDANTGLDFGIGRIKLADAVLYDKWDDSPYADDFQSGCNFAMGITIVLRAGDSANMSNYVLNSVLCGEVGSENTPVDESLYNWDTAEQCFTITIPHFEATNPGVAISYSYNE